MRYFALVTFSLNSHSTGTPFFSLHHTLKCNLHNIKLISVIRQVLTSVAELQPFHTLKDDNTHKSASTWFKFSVKILTFLPRYIYIYTHTHIYIKAQHSLLLELPFGGDAIRPTKRGVYHTLIDFAVLRLYLSCALSVDLICTFPTRTSPHALFTRFIIHR